MNWIIQKMIDSNRRDYEQLLAGRTIPEQAKEGVQLVADVPYVLDGNPKHTIDIFVPDCSDTQIPVIVNIHGGGLIMGDKAFNRHFCYRMSQMGFLVFSVTYRLCPEVTAFQQLQDIAKAMNRVDHLVPQYRGKQGLVHVVADSAGAFLALYTAALQRNPTLAKAAGVRPSYLEIQSMALISGMFYTLRKDKIGLVMPKVFYGDAYKSHPFYPYLNPAHLSVSISQPPCMLITSRKDFLHNYSLELASALRRGMTPCILKDYGDGKELTHAFPVFEPELPASQKVLEDIKRFFLNNNYE